METKSINKNVKIGHVHLRVSNLDRSLDFYCGVLGFILKQQISNQAAFIAAGGYHHHIGLNTWESNSGASPPVGSTGLYHLAIFEVMFFFINLSYHQPRGMLRVFIYKIIKN